jgi:hypothetical protein
MSWPREQQPLICDQKSPNVGSLQYRDSFEVQNSNLKFLLYYKPKCPNKTKKWGLLLVNVLRPIQ